MLEDIGVLDIAWFMIKVLLAFGLVMILLSLMGEFPELLIGGPILIGIIAGIVYLGYIGYGTASTWYQEREIKKQKERSSRWREKTILPASYIDNPKFQPIYSIAHYSNLTKDERIVIYNYKNNNILPPNNTLEQISDEALNVLLNIKKQKEVAGTPVKEEDIPNIIWDDKIK